MGLLWMACLACGDAKPSDTEPRPAPAPKPAIEVPVVAGLGYQPFEFNPETGEPAAIATPIGLTFQGTPIVPIRDGGYDPSDIDGGRDGMEVRKVVAFTRALLDQRATKGERDVRIALLFGPKLPYGVLVQTMYSMKQGGAKKFDVVAKVGDNFVAVPITLPDKAPRNSGGTGHDRGDGGPKVSRPGADLNAQIDAIQAKDAAPADAGTEPPPPPADGPLGLYVSITKTELIVWSTSKLEGTLREPKARIPNDARAAAELGKTLLEIVKRRWAGSRPDDSKAIVIQAHRAVPMQTIAEVMGVVRAAPDRTELFPEIQLSGGFE